MIIFERPGLVNRSWAKPPEVRAAARCPGSAASVKMEHMEDRTEGRAPLIVAFIDDLMSETRIQSVALGLGYQLKTYGRTEAFVQPEPGQARRRPGEPVEGPLAPLVEWLTSWQPALLIFDLADPSVDWRQWLRILKSSPATRRIPVICYGAHVDRSALAEARALTSEADAVLPRSRFFSTLPELIPATAREFDYAAIGDDCRGSPSAEALNGLQAFDEGRYFEAHEHLENAWNADNGPARELYRAVLQVAVAYLQIERRNFRGAMKMFLRARQWLGPLPDSCHGVDVARLRLDAESVRQSLAALGPKKIDQFDLQTLPPVLYDIGGGSGTQSKGQGAG
jgi:CheY-like chemotaxis protein